MLLFMSNIENDEYINKKVNDNRQYLIKKKRLNFDVSLTFGI